MMARVNTDKREFLPPQLLRAPSITNASDAEIESLYKKCDGAAEDSAKAVFIGVACEFLIALSRAFGLLDPLTEATAEIWATLIADAMVALGVLGEIGFSRKAAVCQKELVKRSSDRLAIAEKQAWEARERAAEIEKLTAWRTIKEEQATQIVSSLSHLVEGVNLLIEYETGDAEAFLYGRQILDLFWRAGVRRISSGRNSFIEADVFETWICTAPTVSAGAIVGAFAASEITLNPFQRDLSQFHCRDGSIPSLYVFIGPKMPPMLAIKQT